MKPERVGKPLTVESPDLARKRAAILQWAGKRWALHPDNTAKRLTPPAPFFGHR